MKNKSIFSVLAVLALFTFCKISNAQIPPALSATLQFKLDSIRTANNLKGVSAAIVIPNMGTWLGVSGISFGTDNIQPNYRFSIASNTKMYISTLMLKLQEANVLSLNDMIYQWLPNLGFPNIDSAITIRQLLNHTSGVYNINSYPGYKDSLNADYTRNWQLLELLEMVNAPYFPKGTGFYYSNTNYLLAGMIINAATGSQVSFQLRQNILIPGNLNATFFEGEEPVTGTIAHSWDNASVTYTIGDIFSLPRNSFNSHSWTSGTIKATAEDQARFYQYVFNGPCLTASSKSEMLTVYPISPVYGYGLGVFRDTYTFPPNTLYYHGGNFDNVSFNTIDSINNVSICLQINQSYSSIGAKAYSHKLLKVVLDYLGTLTSFSGNADGDDDLIMLYPVPATNTCYLNTSLNEFTVSVSNTSGQCLIYGQNIRELELRHLSEGLYFVTIEGKNGRRQTKKLQITR